MKVRVTVYDRRNNVVYMAVAKNPVNLKKIRAIALRVDTLNGGGCTIAEKNEEDDDGSNQKTDQ